MRIIPQLKMNRTTRSKKKPRPASLTEEGNARVEKLLGVDNLYDSGNMDLVHHVVKALQAYALYKRDVDYVVKDGEVIIVDEFTGRMMPGRRWSDGLHQAVEAKEGVKIANENQTLGVGHFSKLTSGCTKIGRYDGDGRYRSGRVRQDLQSRSHGGPDQSLHDPQRLRRHDLSDGTRKIQRHRGGDQGLL